MQAVTRVPVRDDLRALDGYHSPQVNVGVRLNTNESPFPPPPAWRDAFAAELSRVEWQRYPDRAATQLREGIAAIHGVRPAQVFAANGSNEVLQTLLLTFAGPGRTVATFEPTYQLHGHIARLTGAHVAEGERAPDFTLDLAEVVRVLRESSPTVTFLCSPNNPTGLVESEANVRAVLAEVPGLLVVDEMESRVQLIVSERERLSAAMARMPIDVFPSGANFILFRPRLHGGRRVWQGLLERDVLVRDCSGWPRLENCLRVTVGAPEENDVFLNALAEVTA
ncbi:MAG: aminotransferase class I/II-fold pyridoxal phosphate-dependent enzyme [Actinomycetota bacterium]